MGYIEEALMSSNNVKLNTKYFIYKYSDKGDNYFTKNGFKNTIDEIVYFENIHVCKHMISMFNKGIYEIKKIYLV